MIKATFYVSQQECFGFCVAGHAMFADAGEDIVCAAVSCAVQMTANGVTEVAKAQAEVRVGENEIVLHVRDNREVVQTLLEALRLQLELLREDYPGCIDIMITEGIQ